MILLLRRDAETWSNDGFPLIRVAFWKLGHVLVRDVCFAGYLLVLVIVLGRDEMLYGKLPGVGHTVRRLEPHSKHFFFPSRLLMNPPTNLRLPDRPACLADEASNDNSTISICVTH